MTRDEITALSGRELDAAIAQHVMGWRAMDRSRKLPHYLPHYSTSLDACAEAEEEHPNKSAYAYALADETCGSFMPGSPEDALAMATASADQRCRAMLLALEEVAGHGK